MDVLRRMRAAAFSAAILGLTACGGSDPGDSGVSGGGSAVSAASAVSLPAEAVSDGVFAGVYVDFAALTADDVKTAAVDALTRVTAKLPDDQRPDPAEVSGGLDESLVDFTAARQAMTDGGGRGVLVMMSAADGDARAQRTMLVHKNADADDAKLLAAMSALRDGETFTASPVGDEWLHLTDTAGQLSGLPTAGSADVAEALSGMLNGRSGDIRFGICMTDALRTEMTRNPPAPEAAEAVAKLMKMTGGSGSVSLGANANLGFQCQFASAEEAEAAQTALSDLMTGAKLQFKGQMAQMPDGPAPESIDAFFATLEPSADGAAMNWRLGASTLDAAGELVPGMGPMMTGMMMMGLMGAMGGM